MSADDVLKILDSIARYIVYFYPGYITLYVYNFIKAKTLKDEKGTIIKAVVLSFLYKTCIDKLQISSEIAYHFWLILISVVVPYMADFLQKKKALKNILEFLNIPTSLEENEIDMLETEKTSPWLRVYMRDRKFIYEGYLGNRELEEGKRCFISLKQYEKYVLDQNGIPESLCTEKNETDDDVVVIYYDDIMIIEKKNICEDREAGNMGHWLSEEEQYKDSLNPEQIRRIKDDELREIRRKHWNNRHKLFVDETISDQEMVKMSNQDRELERKEIEEYKKREQNK